MFAFGFVDVPGRRLLLARDRLGVKQLYFADVAAGFFFASEPKALLALPWVRAKFAELNILEFESMPDSTTDEETAIPPALITLFMRLQEAGVQLPGLGAAS